MHDSEDERFNLGSPKCDPKLDALCRMTISGRDVDLLDAMIRFLQALKAAMPDEG
ncbi:MAG TPA: hypothetical protein VN442_08625 [Bryobacteraceae bacterium]|nr:hypothetical protein [Bryobacteraceae bacterium]